MWRDASGPVRLLIVVGALLAASGVLHIGVYLVVDWSWDWPVWLAVAAAAIALSLIALSYAVGLEALRGTAALRATPAN